MPMTTADRPEFKRGLKDARNQLPLIQTKWPNGFPADAKRVRPLVVGIAPTVAAEMGWNFHYTRGVLSVWKRRTAYCQAVLRYEKRYHLDGTVSDEPVDDNARTGANEALTRIAAKRAKAAKELSGQAKAPSAVMPTATPNPADVAAWQTLPRHEQLHRLQAKLAHPDCATASTVTMSDVLSNAQASALQLIGKDP